MSVLPRIPRRVPFRGTKRELIVAFDIGTTFSGVSYCILDPGLIPEIRSVTRFPGQEGNLGNAKIPSLVYYSRDGRMLAVGAEGLRLAESEDSSMFIKSEWFKLHLAPKPPANIPPLPRSKTAVDVLSDFLQYLFICLKTFLSETHPSPYGSGSDGFWKTLTGDVTFILSHPNGWGGLQQGHLKQAAINSGLVSGEREADKRIRFVSEGEASLHFCLLHGLPFDTKKKDSGVIIVDAGGGTVDVSTYAPQSSPGHTLSVKEITTPQCKLAGSIFVKAEAEKYFKTALQGSNYRETDLTNIIDRFDETGKTQFIHPFQDIYIRFGSARDNEPSFNIRQGQIRVSGGAVAAFFRPPYRAIMETVRAQQQSARECGFTIKSVFLVGGLAANKYLFDIIRAEMEETMGLQVYRPDAHVNKAAAEGGVSFSIDHFVSTRVARHTYGCEVDRSFDGSDSEHNERYPERTFICDSGELLVRNGFDVILPKGTSVSETTEFRCTYFLARKAKTDLEIVTAQILVYNGQRATPKWTDVEPDKFPVICTVEANMKQYLKSLKSQKSKGNGQQYYDLKFDVILLFGLTELKAQVAWIEKGKEKRYSNISIYDLDC